MENVTIILGGETLHLQHSLLFKFKRLRQDSPTPMCSKITPQTVTAAHLVNQFWPVLAQTCLGSTERSLSILSAPCPDGPLLRGYEDSVKVVFSLAQPVYQAQFWVTVPFPWRILWMFLQYSIHKVKSKLTESLQSVLSERNDQSVDGVHFLCYSFLTPHEWCLLVFNLIFSG